MITLLPEQQEAVDKLSNGKILCGDVGSGKTVTSLAYFYTKVCGGVIGDLGSMRTPRDLIVITTAKKRDSMDWTDDAIKLGLYRDAEFSTGNVSITVDSWNNINKYKERKDAFFIFDEQRLVGSGAWVKAFIKIAKHNKWIILSATPGDTWLDYIPVFIANGFYKNRTEFKDTHVEYEPFSKYPKVKQFHNVGRLVRYRNALLVEMPVPRHTTRHYHEVSVDYDREEFDRVVKKRWHVYENRPLKNVSELFSVMRRVVNSDSSRLDAVRQLMSRHPKLIVFYNFDYELEMLRSLAESSNSKRDLESQPSTRERSSLSDHTHGVSERSHTSATSKDATDNSMSVSIAEWNGHKHEPIPTTDRWLYLVQYRAGAEGWNCVETDTVVFYTLTYSYRDFYQCQGRIDRLNTPFTDLHYYIFRSKSLIDRAIARSLKMKKSFNEKEFVGQYTLEEIKAA